MTKKLMGLVGSLLIFCSAGSARIAVEQETGHGDLPQPLPVFVVEIQQNELTGEIGDLGSFASSLIHLRLLQVASLTVHQVPKAPVCGSPSPASKDGSSNRVVQSLGATPAPSGDFYIVQGTLEVRLPDVVLGYSVDKCEGQNLQRVFQDTEAFSLDHALSELTIAAHAIAFKIERVTPPTHVAVGGFQLEGDANVNVQDAVRNEITQTVSKLPDFAITDTGDYKIGGKIAVQKNAPLFRVFAKGAIGADLHIDAHGKIYPLKSVSGTRDDLPKFCAQVAAEVGRGLPGVVLAEHLQLPEVLENMKTEALLSKGSQLLDQCPKQGGHCGSAQDAIVVLSAAAHQGSASWRVSWTLGRAQMLTGKDNEATNSLEMARQGMKEDRESGKPISPLEQTQVLNTLGDAYRNSEKYDQSEAVYDESLRIIPSQLELYSNKALALELNNKRPEALATLLQGLQVADGDAVAQSFHDSAKDIIRALQTDQFEKVEDLLAHAYGAGVPAGDEYALLMARKWGELLDTNVTREKREEITEALEKALDLQPSDPDIQAEIYAHLARAQLIDGDRQKLESFLTKAENLPRDKVSAGNREWIGRMRALDCMRHNEYERAHAYAEAARRIKPTDDATLMLATAALLLAQEKEKAPGSRRLTNNANSKPFIRSLPISPRLWWQSGTRTPTWFSPKPDTL
jgi:tetratricopeptide (TPR) repeat protein